MKRNFLSIWGREENRRDIGKQLMGQMGNYGRKQWIGNWIVEIELGLQMW
jgi:hypothetical protein